MKRGRRVSAPYGGSQSVRNDAQDLGCVGGAGRRMRRLEGAYV